MRNHNAYACWRNNILEKQAMRAAKWYAENNEYATSWILSASKRTITN